MLEPSPATTTPADPRPEATLQGRPATVLRWLRQGHQRFLEGHSLHPHSTRDRMRAVVAGYSDLHSCAIDWMGSVEPVSYPVPPEPPFP